MRLRYQLSAAIVGTSIALVQSYSQPASALTAPEVSQIAKQITVRIEDRTGGRKRQGSGFIIKQENDKYYVLTAYHVIANETKYTLTTSDGERYTLDNQKIIYKSGTDLAVVQFVSHKTYQIAKIGNSNNALEGTTVYVAGFPVATSAVDSSELYRFVPGQVSANASKPLSEGYSLVYTNPTIGGMSGGPVLNEKGEVIAIHGRAETQAQSSGDGVKIASTGNNLGISVNTFLRLALLDIGEKAPPIQIVAAPKADDFVLKAADLLDKKDYRGAIETLNNAIEINPKYAKAYYARGIAYYEVKEYRKALADYTQSLEIDPKNAFAYNNRGNAYSYLKEYRKALADYTQSLEIDPKNALVYSNRGSVYSYLQEHQKAIVDFSRAIANDSKLALAYYNRGLVRSSLQEHQKAIADYTQAISIDPKDALAYNNRGSAYSYLQKYQKAIADYTQAIAIDSKLVLAYYNRGVIHKRLKEYQKAIADFSRVIDSNPKSALTYYNRGLSGYEARQIDAAIEDWYRTININNRLAQPKLALAVALYGKGKKDEALQLWQQGIDLLGKVDLQVLKQANWGDELLKDAAKLLEDASRNR